MRILQRITIAAVAGVMAGQGTANDRAEPGVRKAMSAQEVRQLLGPPNRVSRQLLYRRHIEQWVYENPHPARIALNCVRGEDAVVIADLPSPVTLP